MFTLVNYINKYIYIYIYIYTLILIINNLRFIIFTIDRFKLGRGLSRVLNNAAIVDLARRNTSPRYRSRGTGIRTTSAAHYAILRNPHSLARESISL